MKSIQHRIEEKYYPLGDQQKMCAVCLQSCKSGSVMKTCALVSALHSLSSAVEFSVLSTTLIHLTGVLKTYFIWCVIVIGLQQKEIQDSE